MAGSKLDHLHVAVVTAAHGIHGEVKIKLLSDVPERLLGLKKVLLYSHDEKTLLGDLDIESVRGSQNEILKFAQIEDRNQAEKIKGCFLSVSRDQAYSLEDGQYFIADILGLHVLDAQRGEIGTLKDVLDSPTGDIFLIKRPGLKDLLLPLSTKALRDVDFLKGQIYIQLPDGLWEVYD